VYAGHLGFALGAYSFRRTIPLWLLLIAAQIPDWLDAGMCLADVSRGPYGLHTHGIYVVTAVALVAALLYAAIMRDGIGACIVAATIASHYGLDYLTGIKPTWPGGPIIGLNLYDRPAADALIEGVTITIGWIMYRRTLPPQARNDGMAYAVLFSLLAFQLVAGIIFVMKAGEQMKC
jgi:hypothetical protein